MDAKPSSSHQAPLPPLRHKLTSVPDRGEPLPARLLVPDGHTDPAARGTGRCVCLRGESTVAGGQTE